MDTLMSLDAGEIYGSLDTSRREVRLVRLLRSDAAEIECELKVFSLDDPPSFRALSYCWGEASPNHTIRINDSRSCVRPNLHAYLEVLRSEVGISRSHSPWIFVDAICINQHDSNERSSQILLMTDVYSNAELVVVWPGESYPLSPETTKAVGRLCNATVEEIGQMDPICAAFEGFMFVFAWAEYWSRLWIVPEIALARELSLRRGPLGTSAARLFRCVYLKLESQELFGVYSRPHNTAVMSNFLRLLRSPDGHGQSKFMCFSLLRRKLDEVTSGCGPQLYHITDALATYSAQRCTIARDRIYGLLSLTTSICKPDYAAPSIIVYLQILVENLLVQPFNADYADWEGVEDQVRRGGLIFYTLAALQLSLENTDVLFFTYLAATECGVHDTLIWNILYAACLHKHNKPRLTMLLSYARKRSVAKFVRLIIGHLHRMPAHWQNKISEYNTIVCEIVEDVRMRLRQREETNTDAPVARFSTVEGATPRHTPPD